MNRIQAILTFTTVVCLFSAPVLADSFGDKIAQRLCYTMANSITLSADELAQYDTVPQFYGQYISSKNGITSSAKFSKQLGNAFCEKSDCPAVGNCPAMGWPITKNGNKLEKTTFTSNTL